MSVMTRPGRTAIAAALWLLATIPLVAVERFRAIEPRVGGAPGGEMIRVSISITDYTTAEEARSLQQAAARGGQTAVLGALKTMNHGSVSITGSAPAVIHAARADPTGSGRRRILIFCGRPLSSTSDGGDVLRVIELQVDRGGQGDGRLIDAASVRLDDQGFVEIERQLSTPRMLVEVRPEK